MKKLRLCFLLLVMLSGCSREPEEIRRGLELRTKLLRASEVSFETDITADYGDKLHRFSLSCKVDADGAVVFTVTAPEIISGITGRISREGGALTFDDTALHFELMTDDQLSPVSGPWILVKTLRSGYLTSAGREGDGLRLTIDDSYEEDALTLDIWLDSRDMPERAEIHCEGRRILTLEIRNLVIL